MNTIIKSVKTNFSKHTTGYFWLFYICLVLALSYTFYRRFPNNFQRPNFFAEDGFVFAKNIMELGFFKSFLSPFNGYFIFGIYLLELLGFILNFIFFNNLFINLPRSFALISYLFMGITASLPILLFKNYFQKITLLYLTVLTLFVPLIGNDYAIIGTIGNAKFVFFYIGFLLIVYRNMLHRDSKQFYLVDIIILLCAYTNAAVYALLPYAMLRYLPFIEIRKIKKSIYRLLQNKSFISFSILSALLLPQIIYVLVNGLQEMPGYLDSPFNYSRLIEIFIGRSTVYAFFYPIYSSLNNLWVILIFIIGMLVALRQKYQYKSIYLFGIYAIIVNSILLVISRPGISVFFNGYKGGGPDQFFYAQNMIYIFITTIVIFHAITKSKRWVKYSTLLVFTIVMGGILIPKSGTFGQNDTYQAEVGSIYLNAMSYCSATKNGLLNLPAYPSPELTIHNIPREDVCTENTQNYTPLEFNLGLKPLRNNYVAGLGSKNKLTQTFVSPYPNLNGIGIYFSNFNTKVTSPYRLILFDVNCTKKIHEIDIPVNKIKDNMIMNIDFPKLDNSENKEYCFSVLSTSDVQTPLAVQLSGEDEYQIGLLTINSIDRKNDIVFNLHYRK